MKANYHTHTWRCGHATGEDEEYVLAAIERGFGELGFADHVPWPYTSGFANPSVRMEVSQMDAYLRRIHRLSERYTDRIRLFAGFECEYFPAYMGWLADIKQEKEIDYLILGNHYLDTDETGMHFGYTHTAEELRLYVDRAVRGMRTGLFAYLAHPDFFMRGYQRFDSDCRAAAVDLCAAAKAMGMPLEYNLHERFCSARIPRVSYPDEDFFDVVYQSGAQVIIGLDAHDPKEILDGTQWDRAAVELARYGGRLVRRLPLQPGQMQVEKTPGTQ